MKNEVSFTEGRIMGPLLRFTLPILAAMLLQALYGGVDLMVMGWFGGAADVSAVSTGSQTMQTLTTVVSGLCMGVTILLGLKLGSGEKESAGRVIGSGVTMFALLAGVLTLVVSVFAGQLTGLMQAPEEAFGKTAAYVRICALGSVFIVAYNVLGSVFRGLGDSRTPLLAVGIACAFNVAGDLLFVAGFHWGAAGAALATVLAQGLSVGICLLVIRKRGLPFPFRSEFLKPEGALIREILRLGVPVALQDALVSVSFMVVLAIVNSLGVIASAGVGIAEKLCGFIMLVPSSFMQALSAFVAQNIGAQKPDRAKKALRYAVLTSLAFGVGMAYCAFFHGDLLARIFASSNGEVVQAAAQYLKAYALVLSDIIFVNSGQQNWQKLPRANHSKRRLINQKRPLTHNTSVAFVAYYLAQSISLR